MARLILMILFFLVSLLAVLPAPTYHLWYLSVAVTEFPLIFLVIVSILLAWGFVVKRYRAIGTLFGMIAFLLFLSPVVRAYIISIDLDEHIEQAFGKGSALLKGSEHAQPFCFWKMAQRSIDKEVPHSVIAYRSTAEGALTMDFYHAQLPGLRPVLVVVHGGSWSAGDSRQLPELNSYLALKGYNVASINYRLAPEYKSPAPLEDVYAALAYLRSHSAELSVDTNNFVLLGRSAGGQIALCAAYGLHDRGIKGVINFYGPSNMIYGYLNPANPLVIDTRRIMEDYLGGSYSQVPQNYEAASAVKIVTAPAVPTLIIHGQNDPLVTYLNAPELVQKLTELKVPHLLLTLPWATHGCDYTLNGPSGQLSAYTVERFLHYVASR